MDARSLSRTSRRSIAASVVFIGALVLPGSVGAAIPSLAPNQVVTQPPLDDPYADPGYDPYADPGYDPYADPGYDPYADPGYDPYADETYDDTQDPCDPAVHPDPTSDPYCDPDASYDSFYDTTVPPFDAEFTDPCDPSTYPGWAEDPYCNPALWTAMVTPDRLTAALTDRASNGDEVVPLSELDPSEAPAIGAGRMLLAVDAIAELGGFERATTPRGATLLRDIREGIPSEGLDEAGYTTELERFVLDFIPFLESLAASGVTVSDELWDAAFDLEEVVFGEFDPATADPDEAGLLDPQPWLLGLADLLVRGGEAADIPMPEVDESAIRDLLTAFAFAEPANESTTTTQPAEEMPPPTVLALQTGDEELASSTDTNVAGLVAAGATALTLAGLVAFVLRRRRRTPPRDAAASILHPEPQRSAISSPRPEGDTPHRNHSKASVTELLDASRRMSASLDAVTIASIALSEAKRIVGAEGGIVVRRTVDGLEPVGCEPPMLFNYENLADGCLLRVIETGRSIASVAHDEPLLVEVPMAMGAVPIVADGVITGAILVVRVSAKPFDRDELDALEMLAPLVGSAFAVADTHETATELVDVEPLTGLQNRRRLDLDLASISTDDEVAYVMVDIDHFKNFNDTNGHAAGDEALRQVSALLRAAVRPNDLVYRYGGEEFCVLLPGATAQDAAIVAERARAAVEAADIPGMQNQPAGRVTISVGVSDSAFGTPSDLVERADAALYESKRNGRNRVTLSAVD